MSETDPNTANWLMAGITTVLGWLGWQSKRQIARIDSAHVEISKRVRIRDCKDSQEATRQEFQETISSLYQRLNEIHDDNIKRSDKILLELLRMKNKLS